MLLPSFQTSHLALREKCPYSDFFPGPYFVAFGLNKERYSVPLFISLNAGKHGPEKLRIRTLFTQCGSIPKFQKIYSNYACVFPGFTLLPKNLFDMIEILNLHLEILLITFGS